MAQSEPGVASRKKSPCGQKLSFVFLFLTMKKRWLQRAEFSDYNNYSHLFLPIRHFARTVVVLRRAKVIANVMRQGREALFHLGFFLLLASVSTYNIIAVLSDHNSIFATIKSFPCC